MLIGEEGGDHLYIDKNALKQSIHNTQVLSALLYKSEKHLSREEQEKMKRVIARQRELLRRREEVIKTEEVNKSQIKALTEELLKQLNDSYNLTHKGHEEDQVSHVSAQSEGSSIADEREIQQKLHKILHILNQQSSSSIDEEEIIDSEALAQEVFQEAGTDQLQLYVIQAKELEP